MAKDDMLLIKKKQNKIQFKVKKFTTNAWSPAKYEKIIAGNDYNLLAFLLYDLNSMGFPVSKAYDKFKNLMNEPELFFL